MAKRIGFLLLAIIALLTCSSLVSGCSLTPNRHVYLNYSFFVEPLEGEYIKDVVLYLPFPNHDGKAIGKAFTETKQNHEKYHSKQDYAALNIVHTKHGDMLRVELAWLKRGMGSGCEIGKSERMPITEYYLWQESGNHIHPYLYNPRLEVRKKGKKRYAHSVIYSQGNGGSGFKLTMRYDISERAPSPFPFIFGHEWGGDFIAFFGVEDPPEPIPGSAGVPIEIREFGWKKIPVAECE